MVLSSLAVEISTTVCICHSGPAILRWIFWQGISQQFNDSMRVDSTYILHTTFEVPVEEGSRVKLLPCPTPNLFSKFNDTAGVGSNRHAGCFTASQNAMTTYGQTTQNNSWFNNLYHIHCNSSIEVFSTPLPWDRLQMICPWVAGQQTSLMADYL